MNKMTDIEPTTFAADNVAATNRHGNPEPSIFLIMVESFLLFHTPKVRTLYCELAYTAALTSLRDNRGEEAFHCCHTREVEVWRLLRLLELKKIDIKRDPLLSLKTQKLQIAEFDSLISRLRDWVRQDSVLDVLVVRRNCHRTTA